MPEQPKPSSDRSITARLVGRLDKPFHRPECQCEACRAWDEKNPKPKDGE